MRIQSMGWFLILILLFAIYYICYEYIQEDKQEKVIYKVRGLQFIFLYARNAINDYFRDNNNFPPNKQYWGVIPGNLTTPISYLKIVDVDGHEYHSINCVVDPFSPGLNSYKYKSDFVLKGGLLKYLTDGKNYYIICSTGPDSFFQVSPDIMNNIKNKNDWEKYYFSIKYDPTNGLYSKGDILSIGIIDSSGEIQSW